MNRSERKLSKMMSRTLLALAIQGIVASTGSLAGNIYYVGPGGSDSNVGDSSAPFATIRHAVQEMDAGDKTIVMDGKYVEPMVVFQHPGPITLEAQNEHGAILSSTSGCNPAIDVRESYITIKGLQIEVDDANVECTSRRTPINGAIVAWGGGSGYGGPDPTAPNTSFSHCVLSGLKVVLSSERDLGIRTLQDFCTIENNEIWSSIETFDNIGTVIRDNIIHGGDTWGAHLFAKGGVRNTEIYNNRVHVKATPLVPPITVPAVPQGIIIGGITGRAYVFDEVSPFEAYNSVAYNNVVINESGGDIYAIGMQGSTDSAIFNNVVIGQGRLFLSDGYAPGGGAIVAKTTNAIIRNNIFSCDGGGVKASGAWWTYAGTLTINNNNFYNCGSDPSQIPTQTNAVTGNPLFVDPTDDWHVAGGSPAIGSGYAIASFTGYNGETIVTNLDKDGVARSTPWDIGIYVIDTDGDGVRNSADNCPSTVNATQTDIDANSVGDACQHGLTARYFNDSDTNSSGLITEIDDKLVAPAVLQRIDSNVDFNWGLYSSPASGVVTSDYFSTRWTGRLIVPAYTGTYQFCLKGDDGVRLWVNNVDLFGDEHWVPQDSVTDCATINLTAGQAVPIKVEFFDLTEDAIVKLSWSWPGQAEVVVPSSALYAE